MWAENNHVNDTLDIFIYIGPCKYEYDPTTY